MTDQDNSADPINENPEEKPSRIIQLFSNVFLVLRNSGTFIVVSGFFVVQSYLASITTLFTYNISINQYVAAGVSLVLYIPYKLLSIFFDELGQMFVTMTRNATIIIVIIAFALILLAIASLRNVWRSRRGNGVMPSTTLPAIKFLNKLLRGYTKYGYIMEGCHLI